MKHILKNKEVFLYLIFGILTFIVSITSYYCFCDILELNELISNILSWIVAVTFAFLTNRTYVFNAYVQTPNDFFKQMVKFYSGRFFTLILEEALLFIFVIVLSFPNMIVKIFAQILVIIANYIISKKIIFK